MEVDNDFIHHIIVAPQNEVVDVAKCVLANTLQKSRCRTLFDPLSELVVSLERLRNDHDSIVVIDNARPVLVCFGDPIALRQILLLRPTVGVEIGSLSLIADADRVATVWREAVGCAMVGDAIVPEGDIARLPLEAGVELRARCNNLVEQADDVITFCLGDTDNLCDESRVEKNTLPTCNRMCADERVLCGHWLATHGTTEVACALRL